MPVYNEVSAGGIIDGGEPDLTMGRAYIGGVLVITEDLSVSNDFTDAYKKLEVLLRMTPVPDPGSDATLRKVIASIDIEPASDLSPEEVAARTKLKYLLGA